MRDVATPESSTTPHVRHCSERLDSVSGRGAGSWVGDKTGWWGGFDVLRKIAVVWAFTYMRAKYYKLHRLSDVELRELESDENSGPQKNKKNGL
ncbi:hypothetical protein GWI33_003789 [Rhynchophorus ferrugineus]|uniref:Uncharacterized protein n=1 Tax=Rhynchophorus ferrugineus TaxID=354439 RepID=A0A834LXS6_RHYFE|nr:hypothetical protein GWI33_003789 [Rhynchophorus ferrugineus]